MAPSMKYWDDWVDVEDMEAMWNDSNVSQEWLRAGEERGMKVHMSRNFDGKPYVTHTEMKASINQLFSHNAVLSNLTKMYELQHRNSYFERRMSYSRAFFSLDIQN